jgi:hypothetical protein
MLACVETKPMRALVYDPSRARGLSFAEQLDPNIGWRGSWEQVQAATAALLDRQVVGKAVLDVRAGDLL